MRRFYPFLILLFCIVLLMGCELTIATFDAPDTASTGSVITLTVSGTAINTGVGATEHGVVVQIPAGWRVLYAKANVGGFYSPELTEDAGLAALYTPESGHVIWAGKSDFIPPFNISGNVSVTIKVLTGDFSGSIGQTRVFDLKAVVCAKTEEVWNTEDPKDVYDFVDVLGEKYQKSITVTQSGEDTTAPDPIVNPVAGIIAVETGAVQISWSGYNEDVQGDVVTYRVYRSTNSFSDVSGMNPIAEVSAGHTFYLDESITPSTGYYYGLTAIDEVGNENNAVSTAYIFVYVPGSIAGTLYGADGSTRLTGQNIAVYAYTGSCDNLVWAGTASVDSSTADYTITGLQPGAYYLQAQSNENYFSEWWASGQSVRDCASAQEITVNDGQAVSGKDFQLDPGATISGTVYDSISGMAITGKNVQVTAYTGSPCGGYSWAGTASVDSSTADYTITGLQPGAYYLQAQSNENYIGEWWASGQSVRDCASAQEITVNDGQAVSGKDFQLDPGATISGTVYDSISGMAITGKNVQVTAYTGSPCGGYSWAGTASVDSSTADYTITGLQPGAYYLQAQSNENYIGEWWASGQSVRDCASAQEITVNDGQAVSGKDFQLDPGATISGTVYDSISGMAITGKNISVYAITGSPCSGYSSVGGATFNTTTGTYTISGLSSGTYYLKTWSNENYISEWWASPLSVLDCGGAQSIPVVEGQNVVGKDFQLDPGATISGSVYQSDGITPLIGEFLYVFAVPELPCNNSNLTFVAYSFVDSSTGNYTISGLPPGTYYLLALSNNLYEWWASPFSTWRDCEAQGIVVVGNENIGEKDFQLTRFDSIQKGDINGDGSIGLADLIETLQILTGKNIEVMPGSDANQNGKIGMEEAIYILQTISGVRP